MKTGSVWCRGACQGRAAGREQREGGEVAGFSAFASRLYASQSLFCCLSVAPCPNWHKRAFSPVSHSLHLARCTGSTAASFRLFFASICALRFQSKPPLKTTDSRTFSLAALKNLTFPLVLLPVLS